MIKIEDIHESWGSIIRLDNPKEFFEQNFSHWRDLLYKRKMLVFKNMELSHLEYAKTAAYYGQPWDSSKYKQHREATMKLEEDSKSYIIGVFNNEYTKKKISDDFMPFHADIPNHDTTPFPIRSLWMINNPNTENSGKTFFLNIEQGLTELSDRYKNILDRVEVKQQDWHFMDPTQEKKFSIIKEHPITKNKSLRLNYYVDPRFPGTRSAWIKEVYIDGILQKDCSIIQEMLDDLSAKKHLYYEHTWGEKDLIIFDNYCFVHGRTKLVIDNGEIRTILRLNMDHISDEEFRKVHLGDSI